MAKLDEVEPGTPLVNVRCVPLDNRDAIAIYVLKYTQTKDGAKSERLTLDGTWIEYKPFEVLEPFHIIEGRIIDPLRKVAAELTDMIRDRLWE